MIKGILTQSSGHYYYSQGNSTGQKSTDLKKLTWTAHRSSETLELMKVLTDPTYTPSRRITSGEKDMYI